MFPFVGEELSVCCPCSDAEGASAQGVEQGSGSGSQSPQSVGSGAMDSGTEYLSDSTLYNMDVSMSLCGQEVDTRQITKGKHLLTFNINIRKSKSLRWTVFYAYQSNFETGKHLVCVTVYWIRQLTVNKNCSSTIS